MTMAKTSKNKMKAWRKEAAAVNREMSSIEGMRVYNKGRQAKHAKQMQSFGTGPAAPVLIAGLFERGGIRMPKAEAFRDMLQKLKEQHDAEQAAKVAEEASAASAIEELTTETKTEE